MANNKNQHLEQQMALHALEIKLKTSRDNYSSLSNLALFNTLLVAPLETIALGAASDSSWGDVQSSYSILGKLSIIASPVIVSGLIALCSAYKAKKLTLKIDSFYPKTEWRPDYGDN